MKKNEEELTGISVPEDLQERIRERLTAAALAEEEASLPASFRINRMILPATVLSAAATLLLGVFLLRDRETEPPDTFDDPVQAYASLERTVVYISEKMQLGTDMVREAIPIGEKPLEILKNINEK